jgi:preprotein translocase subunit SecA
MFLKRDHHFIIVDEVDSLLIDEARTPLIISGQVERSTHQFDKMRPLVETLVNKQGDLVSRLAKEAEDLLAQNTDEARYQAGIKLLQMKKGLPQHKRLHKFIQTPEIARLLTKCENDFIIDQKSKVGEKSMTYVEEDLYFVVDEKGNSVNLSEKGRVAVSPDNPDRFLLADLVEEFSHIEGDESLSREEREQRKEVIRRENDQKSEELHNISQLLRAFTLFHKEMDYIVQDNKIIIVDEFTGRPQPGRRYSDGLHQAIEAKENVKIEKETQTLATITIRLLPHVQEVGRMTGTAETEAAEIGHTYKMEVVVIPTNRPITRMDFDDRIYRTSARNTTRSSTRWSRFEQAGPAGSARDRLGGRKRTALAHVAPHGHFAQCTERQAPAPRGRNRARRGPHGRRHHRHQHGGPWDRHQVGAGRARSAPHDGNRPRLAARTSGDRQRTPRGAPH